MATTGDAPLSLTLPSAGDNISLAVLNANYVAINSLADNHEDRLDAVEPLVTAATTAIGSSGSVYNSTRWKGAQVFYSATAPVSGMVEGDIWFKKQA